jgi:hypothetical protein
LVAVNGGGAKTIVHINTGFTWVDAHFVKHEVRDKLVLLCVGCKQQNRKSSS